MTRTGKTATAADPHGSVPAALDLTLLRRRLAAEHGRRYWRSLEELAESPAFADLLERELPRQAAALAGAVDRRQFLRLMSASLALAGLGACTRQPTEKIVPYVRAPEEIVPGEPLFFATAMPLADGATGLLVESHMGRPTKVEGNPEHPASRGATDIYAQASILGLYDPDRAQVITSAGEIRPWSAFLETLRAAVDAQRPSGGTGFHILTETVTSPTLATQLSDLQLEFPSANWHQYEPLARDSHRTAARLAFAKSVDVQYHMESADVILALDADLFSGFPGSLHHTRTFSDKRRVHAGTSQMNRLYVAECTPTITGSMADHRLAIRAEQVEALGRAILAAIEGRHEVPEDLAPHAVWIKVVARDLERHRGACVVIPGVHQSPAAHAVAYAINHTLGNVGRTVFYTETAAVSAIEHLASLRNLVEAMDAEQVELLLILGGNPVLTAPADFRFAERLAKVGLRVHLSPYEDETALLCHWHVPEVHYLESWSDTRAFDGTATIIQPLIAPLYEGKSAHALIAACQGKADLSDYEIVRAYWQRLLRGADFEPFWRKIVHDGVVPNTAFQPMHIRLLSDWSARVGTSERPPAGELEVVFRPDPCVLDGRFANNGWLQELPKPITKLTWDNAALVSPATAGRLALASGDVVELRYRERAVRAPIWIVPGQADDSVTVHLGYGRTRAGRVGSGAGFNAYELRTSDAPWFAHGLEIHKTGERVVLACTQQHHSMEGRHLVREATLAEYRGHPHFAHELVHEPPPDLTLYPPHPYEGHAWAMAIDLNACTGCNACVVACQAENNIPVVGKDEVARGREMHWIRIDRYYVGDPARPAIRHQPVPCMHCENAPCEVVCPVSATVHSSEGLNDMVYNRCVGTKYCSNNCPYKVRRFNFYRYADWDTESLRLAANPDVTVRSRGVMEKCTYCVQRINASRIQAKREERSIRDGEITTACQQACPAEAIVFGDLHDPASRVAKLKQEPRNYALLGDLNTRPRTTYLAALRNPNPELAG